MDGTALYDTLYCRSFAQPLICLLSMHLLDWRDGVQRETEALPFVIAAAQGRMRWMPSLCRVMAVLRRWLRWAGAEEDNVAVAGNLQVTLASDSGEKSRAPGRVKGSGTAQGDGADPR